MREATNYRIYLVSIGLLFTMLFSPWTAVLPQKSKVVKNPEIKLEGLNPDAFLRLDMNEKPAVNFNGIEFYQYRLNAISVYERNTVEFLYSTEYQSFEPITMINGNQHNSTEAHIILGFYKTTPFHNLQLPIEKMENPATITSMLANHFSEGLNAQLMLMIRAPKSVFSPIPENESYTTKLPEIFILTEMHQARSLPVFLYTPETDIILLNNSTITPTFQLIDHQNRKLHTLITIEALFKNQPHRSLTISSHGLCFDNHQSQSYELINNTIPVYLACPPYKENQVTLTIAPNYPLHLSSKTSQKTYDSGNPLTFDLFMDNTIQLKARLYRPYTLVYIDLGNQFLKSSAIRLTDSILLKLKQESGAYSLYASNHLKPIIINDSDLDAKAKNKFLMRLHSLAPNPPGIHQETQLIFESCFNQNHLVFDPLHLIFLLTTENTNFYLRLLSYIAADLPDASTVRCTIILPKSQIEHFKKKDLIQHRSLDKIFIDFKYIK